MFWLQTPNLDSIVDFNSARNIVFLATTSPQSATLVASVAKALLGTPPDDQAGSPTAPQATKSFLDLSLIQVPEVTQAFNMILEQAGVLGDLVLYSWPIHFVPLHDDLLSLNLPAGGFKDAYLSDLSSTVYRTASAVQHLQQRYGIIGRITGKGVQAQQLVDILLRKREERQAALSEIVTSPATDPLPKEMFDQQYTNVYTGTTIDQLVVIDRMSDPLTPLLTQLTYEGLIDEFYGVSESSQADLPSSVVSPPSQQQQQQQQHQAPAAQLQLSQQVQDPVDGEHVSGQHGVGVDRKKVALGGETDQLFHTIRDSNFSIVGQTLNKVARQLQTDYERRHEAKTVNQIKAFVGKLGGLQSLHQSLRFHTALAEDLMSKLQEEEFNKWLEIQQNLVADTLDLPSIHLMIEDLIDRSSSLAMVLRLLCIESVANGGIKEKDFLFFKREILQTYGYQHLQTFANLEKLGLLFVRSPAKPNWFPTSRKQLNLISDQQDDIDPNDIAFTYSGYAPLSVRLVQCAIDKSHVLGRGGKRATGGGSGLHNTGWKGAEEFLKYIPGPRIDEVQHSESFVREDKLRKILVKNSNTSSVGGNGSTTGKNKHTVLVLYIGGITYSEISALRFIAKRSNTFNLMIATTGIISGDKVIDAASLQ